MKQSFFSLEFCYTVAHMWHRIIRMVSKGERDLAEERIATKKSKAYESDASTFSNRLPLKIITVPYFFSKDILSS